MPDQERSTTSRVFHRHLHHVPPKAVSASGIFIRDAAGKDYLDASGGAAVSCLGHGHRDVIAAMHAQIDRLAYAPLEGVRDQLAAASGRPVTFGWGPRFLHSTGQFHKGGPRSASSCR